MDKKIIFSLMGNVLFAFSATFALPIFYAVVFARNFDYAVFFAVVGICVLAVERIFKKLGTGHRRRLPLLSATILMLMIYPLVALFGFLPFVYFGILPPIDAALETVSDLTSAGISLSPHGTPYIFILWQSVLMWFGALIFLVMLVTVIPEVSGNFGMTLSLHGGQKFSSAFGQMLMMSQRITKVYIVLTILSVLIFQWVGLDFWDSILMAMRCISTGGGDFVNTQKDGDVEYAAALVMLLACGNFLYYHRLILTTPPQLAKQKGNILHRGIKYGKALFDNAKTNLKKLFSNSEVKAITLMTFFAVILTTYSTYRHGIFPNIYESFRASFFHVASFLSTTGIHWDNFGQLDDFDKFLIFLLAIFGGCMGSVTGGIKTMRLIVLMRVAASELTKTIHPRMVTVIKVNGITVPQEIVGRILGFFFLTFVTMFVCSAVLSFTGLSFSEAVAMSFSCLTNVGTLPGICEPANFLALPIAGKIFCMAVLIVGRLEIFVVLICVAGLISRRNTKEW